MKTYSMASSAAPARPWIESMDLKGWIQKLPVPLQVVMTMVVGLLLLVDLAIPDMLPFVDEVLLGWLLYSGVTASVAAIKKRKEAGALESGPVPLDVRDQQMADEAMAAEDDPLLHAAAKEVEALENGPF